MNQRGRSQSSVLRGLSSGATVLSRNERSQRGAGIRDFLEALQSDSPVSRSSTRSITSSSRGRGSSSTVHSIAGSDSDSDSVSEIDSEPSSEPSSEASSDSLQGPFLPDDISAGGAEESSGSTLGIATQHLTAGPVMKRRRSDGNSSGRDFSRLLKAIFNLSGRKPEKVRCNLLTTVLSKGTTTHDRIRDITLGAGWSNLIRHMETWHPLIWHELREKQKNGQVFQEDILSCRRHQNFYFFQSG